MLTVTDIKQYFYCRRITYFTFVAPVLKKISSMMSFGQEAHLVLDALENRRKLKRYGLSEGKREFHTYLTSNRLGLTGKLDLHLVTPKGVYPVEYKFTDSEPNLNHKYQLTAYALLLEEYYKKPIRNGFLYHIGSKEIYPIEISQNMRDFTKKAVKNIQEIIKREKMPPMPSQKKKCRDCEFRNYCGDVD